MLLPLVFGVVLVLVGVTASALVAVASAHLRQVTLESVVTRDAALVELFVNANLKADDVAAGGPGAARTAELAALLGRLADGDGIVLMEIHGRDGTLIASSDTALNGGQASASALTDAMAGTASAALLEGPDASTLGNGSSAPLLRELLPINGADAQTRAVISVWRDAAPLLAAIDVTRRDIMLVTLVAAILLAVALYAIFRAAQARLARQHDQLVDASRRDALTGLLNHGSVVSALADDIEAARAAGAGIGLAIVDVDNFRLFNDTHGHEAADEVLLGVAELVGELGEATRIARYGPDEFLILRRPAGTEEMSATIAALMEQVEQLSVHFGDSEALPVSVSVGICAYPEHGSSVTEVLSAAAVAVSEAKAGGGNRACVARIGEEQQTVIGGFDVLQGLVIAVDTKDRYTKRHSEDVARYAIYLARRLGLDDETCETIRLAGLLHDVGKIGIPDVVLRKPSKLTAEEYAMFQQHVALGDAIVRDVPNVDVVRAGIRHHHERWDGKGYLEGLEAEEIPMIGRILAVADAFSAMTTTRPYRRALPVEEAIKRLGDAAGSQLEELLVVSFIEGLETDAHAPMPGDDAPRIWTPQSMVA
ncbi:MAG TPA: diguanylate cyclase [Candidatus Limnocylindria bacterium]|jgi:diguanylate cyclase (GGDEF)-like protein/putative nucleotidyltransferase with HDIG domain